MDLFTKAMHNLAEACHASFIDPATVIIMLPARKHWELLCKLEREQPGFMPTRGSTHILEWPPQGFTYFGFHLVAKPPVDR